MNFTRRLLSILLIPLAVVLVAANVPAQAKHLDTNPIAAFSLVAPNGQSPSGLVARAVMPMGSKCPNMHVTKASGAQKTVAMQERKAPATTAPAFAALISCSANIPANATSVKIGMTSIPAAMPTATKKMAILGDTGCRIKGSTIQDCSTPATWPLSKIATHIASDKPDLIVFTGDFFYREGICPALKTALCGGSPSPVLDMPFADTAYSWNADVFTPMTPMFSAAPIVVTRGNHEACPRGGNGYFIYLDPRPGSENTCAPTVGADGKLVIPTNDLNPTYASDIAVDAKHKLRLVIVDSAYGFDCEQSSIYETQKARYEEAQKLAGGHVSWLVVHRPIVGWQPSDDCGPAGGWVSADQALASNGLLGNYKMMLSSHVHLAQAVNIPGLPGQLVIGNGGTLLEPATNAVPTTGHTFTGTTAPAVTYAAPSSSWQDVRFGYVLATPKSAKQWSMKMNDPSGKTFANCELASKVVTCTNM